MRTASLAILLAAAGFPSVASTGCSDTEAPTASSTASSATSGMPMPMPGVVTGPLGERPDLPIDEQLTIENLSAPVDIVHDRYGRPHIYASSVTDAMRAQGYLIARDRHLQLEFFRRVSEGRLAEILGQTDPSLIDLDIAYRHIGLARVAKAQYDAMPKGALRDALDAYADGVSQVFRKIRSGDIALPGEIFGIDTEAFTDWTGMDSLAIARLQTHLLSFDADSDISNQLFFDAARGTFTAADPDPAVQKRAGLERDLFLFAPSDPATTSSGYPMGIAPSPRKTLRPARPARPVPGARGKEARLLGDLAGGYLRALERSRALLNPEGFGSNNWAIAPSRSATKHALIASDPHLPLASPAIFWPVSIDVEDKDGKGGLKVSGVAFPGLPAIILGHNEHIAWGATVAGYDVSDVYAETLTPDGASVIWNGGPVALQSIDEEIKIQGKAPYIYKVLVVPHHGPIQPTINKDHTVSPPDPKAGALSIRWTGLEATDELGAVFQLLRAHDVDEARQALMGFGVGAQNWMIGDTSGNVLWTSHAVVPIRDPRAFTKWDAKTYQGTLPCLVLPGDGSAEWTGRLPDDLVPWKKNPAEGFISTANNDPIGTTLDNDPGNDLLPDKTPMYLHCAFDIGFREGRIQTRIKQHTEPLTADDLAKIQADVRSAMGAALAPSLIEAIDQAEAERTNPGAYPDLAEVVKDTGYKPDRVALTRELLAAWGKEGDYQAAAGMDLDTNQPLPATGEQATQVKSSQATLIFNTWLVRVLSRTFDDEFDRMNARLGREPVAKAFLRLVQAAPNTLATFDPATGESSLWDDLSTPAIEKRSERMIRALIDAWSTLETLAGPDPANYRWGAHHKITFSALIPLFFNLSIPPGNDAVFKGGFPRGGDSFSVDSSDFGYPKLTSAPNFTYNHGPSQRFVADLDPAGVRVQNALPGGAVWDAKSPHFRDEAELWRKNQAHPVPFSLNEVIANKEHRTVATAP